MADEDTNLVECIMCHRSKQHGNHEYNVPYVPAWGTSICVDCRRTNNAGVVPDSHPDLIAHLKARGIKVKLNAKGWIDIPTQ